MKVLDLILKAVPLAMGIAVVVASALDSVGAQSAFVMLGLGLACVGLSMLRSTKE